MAERARSSRNFVRLRAAVFAGSDSIFTIPRPLLSVCHSSTVSTTRKAGYRNQASPMNPWIIKLFSGEIPMSSI